MTLHDLATLVREMRQKQSEYFRTRSSASLLESKGLEQRVDDAVSVVLDGRTLFDAVEGAE